jgi:hypothetical protein
MVKMNTNHIKDLAMLPDDVPPLKSFGNSASVATLFEEWLDRQTLTPEVAEAANTVLRFLRMPEVPPPLRGMLAEAVRGLQADPTWRQ